VVTRSTTKAAGAMTLQIKPNVNMEMKASGEPIPTIPWDSMFFKDAFDIPVQEDSIKRKLQAVRSAYKRYLLKETNPPEREFYIGRQYVDQELVVRVYCKKGPIREGNQ